MYMLHVYKKIINLLFQGVKGEPVNGMLNSVYLYTYVSLPVTKITSRLIVKQHSHIINISNRSKIILFQVA